MTSDKYTDDILQAMSIIAQQTVKAANFDKTVIGTVINCVDPTIGKYKIRYQDGQWYAFTTSPDINYDKNTDVYILIPNGNMNSEKTIIGTTKKLGTNYIQLTEGANAYTTFGSNAIISNQKFELCSYEPETLVLYDIDDLNSLITIDNNIAQEYLKKASYFIFSGLIQTALPLEQQYNGNYGIRLYMTFKDNATGNDVIRKYILDVDQMEGNPYLFTTAVTQKSVFEIDGENFEKINKIELFVQNFPFEKPNQNADIFISNIGVMPVTPLTEEEKNGVVLEFVANEGYVFTNEDRNEDTREIQAQVKIKAQNIDNNSQTIEYYWFIENNKILPNNLYYNKYGGQGWQCLNQYRTVINNVDNVENSVFDFNPGTANFSVAKKDVNGCQYTKYKCVAVLGNKTYSKQFLIINTDFQYSLQVVSDSGTQFSYDSGTPILTCNAYDRNGVLQDPNNFIYAWGVQDKNGYYTRLFETATLNETYARALQEYNTFKQQLDNEELYRAGTYSGTMTNQEHLQELEELVQIAESFQRVAAHQIYNVHVNEIINSNTFKCSVYDKTTEELIGTASITLVNSLTTSTDYSLVINNGTHTYNYTEAGVAPTSQTFDNPYTILPLTFSLYDKKGNIILNSKTKNCTLEWIVPANNTMLQIPSSYSYRYNEDKTQKIYSNYPNLTYYIDEIYSSEKKNNTIYLKVSYLKKTFIAQTNLSFVKQEGLIATNGSNYSIKIVPYVTDGIIPDYPIVTIPYGVTDGTKVETNWNHGGKTGLGHWFNIEVWHNGINIFKDKYQSGNTSEGYPLTINWSIIKNVLDVSCLEVNYNTGFISKFNINQLNKNPVNIIKATVSYQGELYYATLPILTVEKLTNATSNNFSSALKKNTGFQYVVYRNDGTHPFYNSQYPFEIIVKNKLENGQEEDISKKTKNDVVTTTWNYIGSYNGVNNIYLKTNVKKSVEFSNIQKWVEPIDNYDGSVVNNAISVLIKVDGTNRLRMNIPIHLYLNRYSNSALNMWDGNRIDINEGNGSILAPQVGAGQKESDNSFTGIVMGKVKGDTNGPSYEETGLFGYDHGQRSIFLDAKTGKAEFGKNNAGKIIIDPRNNTATIKSGNYDTAAGTGMQIDLTTPDIRFGSGHFSVDKNGNLTATGGGKIADFTITDKALYSGNKTKYNSTDKDGVYLGNDGIGLGKNTFHVTSAGALHSTTGDIAGWTINDTSLYKGKVGISSDNSANTNIAFWAGNTTKTSAPFRVDFNGKLVAESGDIGSGTNKIHIGTGAIYSGSKSAYTSNANGFYLGTDGISLGGYNSQTGGSNFQVNSSGALTAKTGYIGNGANGFTITGTALYNGKTSYNSNTDGVYIGTNGIGLGKGTFYVTKDGTLHASKGEFSGKITATEGKIGNWYINKDGIANQAGTVKLYPTGLQLGVFYANPNGAIGGSGWSIGANGVGTFQRAVDFWQITADAARVAGQVAAQTVSSSVGDISTLRSDVATLKSGSANNMDITKSTYDNGTIINSSMPSGSIDTSRVTTPAGGGGGGGGGLTLDRHYDNKIEAQSARITRIYTDQINAVNANISDLRATSATVAQLSVLEGDIRTLEADTLKTENLSAAIADLTTVTMQSFTVQNHAQMNGTMNVEGTTQLNGNLYIKGSQGVSGQKANGRFWFQQGICTVAPGSTLDADTLGGKYAGDLHVALADNSAELAGYSFSELVDYFDDRYEFKK